jgi:hypothetical protein
VSATSNLMGLLVIVGAAAVGMALARGKLGSQSPELKFKSKPLLTSNEVEFLARLEGAVPELRFFPQVAMGALMEPAVSRRDGKAYYRLRGMFSQKIVDFVAQRRSDGQIEAVIELDDRTHNAQKDASRDEMLSSAGYRIVRWNSKTKPDRDAIRAVLVPAPPPPPATPTTPHAVDPRLAARPPRAV